MFFRHSILSAETASGNFSVQYPLSFLPIIFYAEAIVKKQCVVRTEFVAYRLICLMLAVNVVYKAVTLIALNCGFAK